MPSYVPPHRRFQTSKGSEVDTALSHAHPGQGSSGGLAGGPQGSTVGHFGASRGRGRGGRSGYSSRPEPRSFADADAVTAIDIYQHFWQQEMGASHATTTLHASKSRPNDLVYVFLFPGANPRWDGDNIIFAKSNLGLLPEIADHIIKHGPWDVSSEYRKSSYGVDELPQVSDPDDDPTNLKYTGNTENAPVSEEFDGAKEDIANDGSTLSASPGTQKGPFIVPASKVYSDMPATLPNIPPVDYNPRPHEPIAVFQGIPGRDHHGSGAKFVFDGWYTVSRVNIIAPQSAELVRMQSQKWERRDRFGHLRPVTRTRDTSAWKSSMRHQWAVIKFAKLESGEAPPPPSIERSTGPASSSVPQKSVTEMLQEMRMEDVHVKHAAPEHEPQTDLIEV